MRFPFVRAALVALAAHALPTSAQSAVTLYGAIDTSIEVTNPGAGYVARMDSGAYRGSRFGVRGAEDIGGGNKILFDLENGFSSADGMVAVNNTIFNRQARAARGARCARDVSIRPSSISRSRVDSMPSARAPSHPD